MNVDKNSWISKLIQIDLWYAIEKSNTQCKREDLDKLESAKASQNLHLNQKYKYKDLKYFKKPGYTEWLVMCNVF